jgi:hypothetical protein
MSFLVSAVPISFLVSAVPISFLVSAVPMSFLVDDVVVVSRFAVNVLADKMPVVSTNAAAMINFLMIVFCRNVFIYLCY